MRISDWSSDVCSSDLIEDEIARTFKRSVAGRRVVDVKDAAGPGLAGVGTGHMRAIAAPQKGVGAKVCEVRAVVERIGRASGRERVCQYVSHWVVAVLFKKNQHIINNKKHKK